jgi:Histone H1-like nucleoprotein HC2/S1 RNA binding domain/Zc3h12a-like Ribonuclease NYN domain
MQAAMKISHVVVDGSNIATEGRDAPSLAQLDEAVQAFVEEYSPRHVTVVVDATFPNRIDRKERQTYEDAVNANELITPPAGAIGRGDAFVLQIARRAGASILSNDSFQEFHGDYPWLFEKGRLIGGKPVPHVGWVFMERAPVRGPTSRRSVSEARKATKAVAKTVASPAAADADDSAGKTPRKRRARAKAVATPEVEDTATVTADATAVAEAAAELSSDGRSGGAGRTSRGVEPYNEALPFIEFVAQHPVGSEVDAVIERFSSHGAYVMVGAARAYLPLRNLADPAPRSAKEVLRVGDEQRFVVVSIDPPLRGIDLAVPGVVDVPAAAPTGDFEVEAATVDDTAVVPAARRTRARKAPAPPAESVDGATAKKGPTTKATAKKGPTKKATANKAPTTKATARKPPATKATAKRAPATKATAKRAPATKATARKSPTDEVTARKAPTGKSTTTKPTAKKATAKRATAKRATGSKATATATAAMTSTAKKATARRSATKAPATRGNGRPAASGAPGDMVVALAADGGDSTRPRPDAAEAAEG